MPPADAPVPDRATLIGTWKFLSYLRSEPRTGRNMPVMGEKPLGFLIYTPEGRMMVTVVDGDQPALRTDEDRITLHKRMVAYSGRYSVEGNQVIHHVDVAWTPGWIGTDLVRFFDRDGDTLIIRTAPTRYGVDDVEQVSTLTLRRAGPTADAAR